MSKRGILFVMGVTLQLLAFFGDHATDIPLLHRIIASRHFHASRTIRALAADPSLTLSNAADRGYSELATILAKHTAKKLKQPIASEIKIKDVNVNGSEFIDGKLATSIHWAFTLDKPIEYKGSMANRGTDSWSFEIIREEIDALMHPNMLVFGLLLFLFGTVLDIIAFKMEGAKAANAEKEAEPKVGQVSSEAAPSAPSDEPST